MDLSTATQGLQALFTVAIVIIGIYLIICIIFFAWFIYTMNAIKNNTKQQLDKTEDIRKQINRIYTYMVSGNIETNSKDNIE